MKMHLKVLEVLKRNRYTNSFAYKSRRTQIRDYCWHGDTITTITSTTHIIIIVVIILVVIPIKIIQII